MAKELNLKTQLPEGLQFNLLKTAEHVREAIRLMKEFALNNYLILARIESTRAYEFLGYDSIESFIDSELRGVVSLRNAMGFIEYVKEQTEGQTLDEKTIVGLLNIYKETKKTEKKPNGEKEKIKKLSQVLEAKENTIEQLQLEIDSLKDRIDEMARERGIDPQRVMLVKTEAETKEFIEASRVKAVQSINSLKSLDLELLKLVGFSELSLALGAIKQALSEVIKLYEQYIYTEDLLEKLNERI